MENDLVDCKEEPSGFPFLGLAEFPSLEHV